MCALLIGKAPDRIPLYFENCELYEVTPTFLQRVWNLDLYRKFDSLKGADLLYGLYCAHRADPACDTRL
jgi:hypothetical protein